MKTILLTGGSGFVGTNLILDLHKKFKIIALVRKNSDISTIQSKCQILRYGGDFEEINHIFKTHKIDGVIHLATKWISSHAPSDIKDIIETNILFGTQLLEAIKAHNVAFFINATTFGAYCNSNSYRPATLYAASKKAFEDIMKYYALVVKKTIFCNLLIFNTFGAHDKTTRLFNLLDNLALKGGALDMSDGRQIVDYTHIKNVVFGFECLIDLIYKNPRFCKNKLFTLQSGNRQTLRELVEMYERLLGKNLQINWGKRAKRELEITKPFSGGTKLPNWDEIISLENGLKELISANFAESGVDSAICAKNPNWGGGRKG
ncbi:NAD-dependent epimerase/dehydratase family protein [Helicobacter sp. 23-1044]